MRTESLVDVAIYFHTSLQPKLGAQKAKVTLVDHHTASESFMKHFENEHRLRGGCPADWVWIVPPMGGSACPVFHQEMLNYQLKPSYEYQEPAWKTHVWSRKDGQKQAAPRKFKFKEIARAVKFTSKLFGKALSQRIKATVLFATETGRSEHYAQLLGNLFSHVFNVNVSCMEDYDIINLEHETLLLVVTSTFGNGDPPDNGQTFARALQTIRVTGDMTPDMESIKTTSFVKMASLSLERSSSVSLESDIGPLSNVRSATPLIEFAVFGLGSSAYPNFCCFGRSVDQLLGALGGERIVELATGDELAGQESAFRRWAQDVFQTACDVFCLGEEVCAGDVAESLRPTSLLDTCKIRLAPDPGPLPDLVSGLASVTGKKVRALKLVNRQDLTSDDPERRTLLVSFSTAGPPHSPGDHLGVFPANPGELVAGVLARLDPSAEPDRPLRVSLQRDVKTADGLKQEWAPHDRLPSPVSLRLALSRFLDLTTPPGPPLLATLAETCGRPEHRAKLLELAKSKYPDVLAYDINLFIRSDDQLVKNIFEEIRCVSGPRCGARYLAAETSLSRRDATLYEAWRAHSYPNLLETLEEFSSARITPEMLLAGLPPLQPRFYSVSSAWRAHPGRIDLTVALVAYRTQGTLVLDVVDGKGPLHLGVCSSYLASAPIGGQVEGFVRSTTTFRLPDDVHRSVIMVGPGTGIAPFRSFWQEREGMGRGELTLVAGCRSPGAQLYRAETERLVARGVLRRLHVAYSRQPGRPKMLQKAFKDDCISRSLSGKWHEALKEGREEVADEPRSGRPTTARTDENVDRVLEVLRTDRRLSIQQIADTLHMSTFVVHGIVTEDLQMRKVCAKLVPKVLTQDQKELRVLRSQELLDLIQNEPDSLNSVVTGDDPGCLNTTQTRMSKSRIKTMIIVFFDIRGIVHCEFVPQGQTVNSAFYLEVLRRLKRRIARVRTDIKYTVKLHHDNATSHTAFIITNFLARSNTPMARYRPVCKEECRLCAQRYVQDVLRSELGGLLHRELAERGGHFYVCGDVGMAEDVRKTLQNVLAQEGRWTMAQAEAFLSTLQVTAGGGPTYLVASQYAESRYHEDIFGLTLRRPSRPAN
ncbi:NOS1 [Cordylochernes scorpioides]|uniref:Nitric oxide synthase n=1 Tax=Cordylochernes scorpioides TaxID=51811 RepID=A0ABY6K480_9ARAC|nr:NOS1 [Cordylochernes scorpioides]